MTLALLALYGLGRYYTHRQTAGMDFAIRDTGAIRQIILAEYREGKLYQKTYLTRKKNGWWVNDSLPAMQAQIEILLKTLYFQTGRGIVHPKAQKNVLAHLNRYRIEVTVEMQKGKSYRFWVGGAAPDAKANYILRVGSNEPYELFWPGFEGYLTTRYYADPHIWQENILFNARAEDLVEVEVWRADENQTWRAWRLAGSHTWQMEPGGTVDSLRWAGYLLAFTGKFMAEDFIAADSLVGKKLYARLRLLTRQNQTYEVEIYDWPVMPTQYLGRLRHSPYETVTIDRYAIERIIIPLSHWQKPSA